MMDEQFFYFIISKNNPISIKITNFEINTDINKKYQVFSSEQLVFYNEHPTASPQEIFNCQLNPIYIPNLEEVRMAKLIELSNYDSSENVNLFYYNNTPMWLDKATRVGLVNSCNSLEAVGSTTINIWYESNYITLPIDTCKQLLSALEVYAINCYNVTEQHRVNIENLTTKEAIENYNFTTNYPEKLHF